MAIKIKSASDAGLVGGANAYLQDVFIVADSEAEILALPGYNQELTDSYGMTVRPNVGSIAVTADGSATHTYILLPKGWTKGG